MVTVRRLIAFGGTRPSRYGDVIADNAGLPASRGGVVLLATVTSLPELVSGTSSVALAEVPDIAVGNALGSCMVNLSMLIVMVYLLNLYALFRHGN